VINSVFLVQLVKRLNVLLEIGAFCLAQVGAEVAGENFAALPRDSAQAVEPRAQVCRATPQIAVHYLLLDEQAAHIVGILGVEVRIPTTKPENQMPLTRVAALGSRSPWR
jgi:hypothetical protein